MSYRIVQKDHIDDDDIVMKKMKENYFIQLSSFTESFSENQVKTPLVTF